MNRFKDKKNTVAIIIGNFIAPTETWILRHANGLAHHRPIVITKRKTGRKIAACPKVFSLKLFSFAAQPLNLLGRAIFGKRFLGYEWIIKSILFVYKVRIIHVHYLWCGIWFYDYLANLDIPVFITAHGSDVNRAVSDPLYREKVQIVFDRADISFRQFFRCIP